MKYVEKNGDNTHSAGCTYDSINNLTALVETINGVERKTSYTYDEDNRPTSVTDESGGSRNYTYDNVGRLSQDVTKQGDTELFARSFTYCNGATSTQVGQINYAGNNYSTYFNYSYETRDLISSVATDGSIVFYDYDDAGNILKREVYPYGQDSDPSARISEVDYTYSDSDWGIC